MRPRFNGKGMLKKVGIKTPKIDSITNLLDSAINNYALYTNYIESNLRKAIAGAVPVGDIFYASRFITNGNAIEIVPMDARVFAVCLLPNTTIDIVGDNIYLHIASDDAFYTHIYRNYTGSTEQEIYRFNIKECTLVSISRKILKGNINGKTVNVIAAQPFTIYAECTDDLPEVFPFSLNDNAENFKSYLLAETIQSLNSYAIDMLPPVEEIFGALSLTEPEKLLARIVIDIETIKQRGGLYQTHLYKLSELQQYADNVGYFSPFSTSTNPELNDVQILSPFQTKFKTIDKPPKIYDIFTPEGFAQSVGNTIENATITNSPAFEFAYVNDNSHGVLHYSDTIKINYNVKFSFILTIPAIGSGGARAEDILATSSSIIYPMQIKVIALTDSVLIQYSVNRTTSHTERINAFSDIISGWGQTTLKATGFEFFTPYQVKVKPRGILLSYSDDIIYNLSIDLEAFNDIKLDKNPKIVSQKPLAGLNNFVTITDINLAQAIRNQERQNSIFEKDIQQLTNRLEILEQATRPSILGTIISTTQLVTNFELPVLATLALSTTFAALTSVQQIAQGQYVEAVISSLLGTLSAITSSRTTSYDSSSLLNQDYIYQFTKLNDNKNKLHETFEKRQPNLVINPTKNNPQGILFDNIQIRSSKIKEFPGSGKIADWLNAHPNSKVSAWARERNLIPEHHFVQLQSSLLIEKKMYVNNLRLGISDGVNSKRGNFNIGSTATQTGSLISQPGVMFFPTVLENDITKPYICTNTLKQYKSMLVCRGAKRSDVLLATEEELNKKYSTNFNLELKNMHSKFDRSTTSYVKGASTSITAGEQGDIINHFTSEAFKTNWNYNLTQRNCQGYANAVFNSLQGNNNPDDHLPLKYSKTSSVTIYNNLKDYDNSVIEIFDKIIAFAPGFKF